MAVLALCTACSDSSNIEQSSTPADAGHLSDTGGQDQADPEDASGDTGEAEAGIEDGSTSDADSYLFAFHKALVANDVAQQQRGYDAVESVGGAVARDDGFAVDLLHEPVRSLSEYQANPTPFAVTSDVVTGKLQGYAQSLAGDDVMIVYSHTHGVRSIPGQHLGGLVLDDTGTEDHSDAWLSWSVYADRLLELPARTLVVLTMSCFSGGLVKYLDNSTSARARWEGRKAEGRNFVVLTSQNATSLSNPRIIEGERINPFTYAVVQAFEGAADGYRSASSDEAADGVMTLAELVDYVTDEAKKYTVAPDADNDPDPQVTGSYESDTVVFEYPD